MIQTERRCGYFASLLKDTIHKDPLSHRQPEFKSRRPTQYQEPTWSWASYTGRVRWSMELIGPSSQYNYKAEVHSVMTESSHSRIILSDSYRKTGSNAFDGSCLLGLNTLYRTDQIEERNGSRKIHEPTSWLATVLRRQDV